MKKFLLLALLITSGPALAAQTKGAEQAAPSAIEGDIATPAEPTDIITTLSLNNDYSTFTNLILMSDLTETLKGEGPFTIFAPTNDAFKTLPEGTVQGLLQPENKEKLINFVGYHILSGAQTSTDILKGKSQPNSLQGTALQIVRTDDSITIDGAKVITRDIPATNGVIHSIDRVIMP